jgi:hypothetical protein
MPFFPAHGSVGRPIPMGNSRRKWDDTSAHFCLWMTHRSRSVIGFRLGDPIRTGFKLFPGVSEMRSWGGPQESGKIRRTGAR